MKAPMEIGSDLELDAARLGARATPSGPWFRSDGTLRLASGREALRLHLRAAAADGRGRLVLPAYLCDSVEHATRGAGPWTVEYVDVADALHPQPEALAEALDRQPERTVFVAVQVFSVRWPAAVQEVVSRAEMRSVLVIEDLTHALLSETPGRRAAFASVRKWFALPEGGVATGAGPQSLEPADHESARRRADAQVAKSRWLRTGEGDKDAFRATMAAHEESLERSIACRAMADVASHLLDTADVEGTAARRRANHDRLRERIVTGPASRLLAPLEPPLPEGVVPLGLPVLADERDRLRRFLIERSVYCPVHWPLPTLVADGPFPVAQDRNRHLMTLVIDQRYGAAHMDHVADLLEEFARS